ncbi:hypothetical protein C0J52_18830 [Blattella germanica]|nr:hypothetical protein C0J52_18830 [Blattella germanica]
MIYHNGGLGGDKVYRYDEDGEVAPHLSRDEFTTQESTEQYPCRIDSESKKPVLDKKPMVTNCVLTADELDEVRETLEHKPTKSLRRLAQGTGISKSTAWQGTKQLLMKPHNRTVTNECESVFCITVPKICGRSRTTVPTSSVISMVTSSKMTCVAAATL